jgi:hypothetical protein
MRSREEEEEIELEQLLTQLVPNGWQSTVGVDDAEIDRLEEIAGRTLPGFYRWFLRKMGREMGPFDYPRMDLSAAAIVDAYNDAFEPQNGRYFLIAYSLDEMVPLHLFYDLDQSVRNDARVVETDDLEGAINEKFETFREMIAWGNFLKFRVLRWPYQCRGLLKHEGADVLSQLHPVLERRRLKSPLPSGTGAYCTIMDGNECSLAGRSIPGSPPRTLAFTLGAGEQTTLRAVLGQIALETSLEIKVVEWTPELPEIVNGTTEEP